MFCQKIVSKSVYKKIDQKSKTDFFSILFYHVFGRFSVRGDQKHDTKSQKNKSHLGPFLASDPPIHHGGPRFLFLFLVFGGPGPWHRHWHWHLHKTQNNMAKTATHHAQTKPPDGPDRTSAWASG
jgi:hypothetical protein